MPAPLEGKPFARHALRFVLFAAGLMTTATAYAGGYDTGERDWDFLFQQSNFAVETGVRYFNPKRYLKNVVGTGIFSVGTTARVKEAEAFSVKRFSLTARLGAHALCMVSFREPWGGHANYGATWVGAFADIEQHFSSTDYGLTCSAYTQVGMGNLHALGGISRQKIKYELIQATPILGGRTTTRVSDENFGWRFGAAYEIPQYALLVSLIYNSAIDYDMTGTVTTVLATTPVFGFITMPQSIVLKARSGIAPGWLAFGSIKWTDWSVTDNMPLCAVGTPVCTQALAVSGLTLLWKDSWTITAGLARQLTKTFTLVGSLTWDQGATQGYTSQTDTWTANLSAVVTPGRNIELRVGGGVGVLTSGVTSTAILANGAPNPVGYTATFGDDLVYTLNASATARF